MGNTNGFASPKQLYRHYATHGAEVGAGSVQEYEQMADAFWISPKPWHVFECLRSEGDTVRFDPTTELYSVMDHAGVIRTFFRPLPCADAPVGLRVSLRQSGRCHEEANNMDYFKRECTRW